MAEETSQLRPGAAIGSFHILSLIGRGGMGEVYRARDTKLGRDVAIKVLPVALAREPDRLARFEQEARSLAALNHPHVGAIHSLEMLGGRPALVLEFVEGPTLAEVVARGPVSPRDALPLALQIAEALEAAHDKHLVHRDLKPANIKIRPDGVLKVLDFGIAKVLTPDPVDATEAETVLAAHTRDGLVVGTAAYMSPEQARGQHVDERTDIFAFGCVVYEMLTGRHAFGAETMSDTIAAVLGREPQWALLPVATPDAIVRLLRRCLEKDRARRWHDIADARIEIEDVLGSAAAAAPTASGTGRRARTWTPWLVAGLSFSAAIGLVVSRPPGQPGGRAPSIQVQRLTDLVGLEETPAISPDGKMVAFVAAADGKRQIWLRLLAGGATLALTKDDVDHYGPRWSPDSTSLIYYTPGPQPGDAGSLWEVPALGGSPRRLVSALGSGDVSVDGTRIAFLRFNGRDIELATAARDGSSAHAVATLESASYAAPRWSPDGRRIAVTRDMGLSFTSDLLIVDVSNGRTQSLSSALLVQGVTWTADSARLIVSSSRGSTMSYPPTFNLWELPVDSGAQTQLTFGEASYEFPDLGAQGQLVVSRVRTQSDVWKFPVTGAPAENARRGVRITRQTGQIQTVSISPDESSVTFLSDNGGHANVWTASVADGEMRPVTREFDPNVVVAVPVWSPRGDWINFLTNRSSTSPDVTLWVTRPDGSNAQNLGVSGAWTCWSGDGRTLYFSNLEQGVYVIDKVDIEGGSRVRVRSDNAIGCQSSRDGSVLYYAAVLTQATGAWDFEVRRASPENGPSTVLGRVAGALVPTGAIRFHALVSPDGRWLAVPLLDGPTTNLWALPTSGGDWRQLTDFGQRTVIIPRRIAWSNDSQHIYASVSDVDSDVVMLVGLNP